MQIGDPPSRATIKHHDDNDGDGDDDELDADTNDAFMTVCCVYVCWVYVHSFVDVGTHTTAAAFATSLFTPSASNLSLSSNMKFLSRDIHSHGRVDSII